MTKRKFLLVTALISLAYLALEIIYVRGLPLVMDEFQGAATVARLLEDLPYRDFVPYKTLLGYYIQLPALIAPGDIWSGLMAVKVEMALINAAALFAMALALARHFRREAVLLGLLLLVCMSTFLERSPDLRVDMLTSLAGLALLLLLLERRWAWAGLAFGASFLISQKGIYFGVAANVALGLLWGVKDRTLKGSNALLAFNLAAAAPLIAYLGFWALLSSPEQVFAATFLSHGDIALGSTFQDIRLPYWRQTLLRNPLFWALGLLAFPRLAERRRRNPKADLDLLLLGYGGALWALCLWHKQPWPYFFVLLIPTVAVLATAFLDSETSRWERRDPLMRIALLAIFFAAGVALPLTRLPANLARSSAFQQHTVQLIDSLLAPGESYVAGLELLWAHPQNVAEIGWLDRRRMQTVHAKSGAEQQQLMQSLEKAGVKLVVESYRIRFLPQPLIDFLDRRFQRLWGNVLVYAPILERPGPFEVEFPGRYSVQSAPGAVHEIDGTRVEPGDFLDLKAGMHALEGPGPMRLLWLPEGVEHLFDPKFREPMDLFPNVYGY